MFCDYHGNNERTLSWIERGVFDYLPKYDIFNGTEFDRFKAIYKQRLEENLSKVECLIKNDLDKGNVAFVLATVCCFEALEELKMPKSDAFSIDRACFSCPYTLIWLLNEEKL